MRKRKDIFVFLIYLIVSITITVTLDYVGFFDIPEQTEKEIYLINKKHFDKKNKEAKKLYNKYQKVDLNGKIKIKKIIIISFDHFDETKLNNKLKNFIHLCKYDE